MTTTKSKLKTASEKNSPKAKTHGLSQDKLMQIHRDTRQPGWSWATGAEIKEQYSISGHTLSLMRQRYGLPQMVADNHAKPAYSLPALEHLLESVPEMLSTTIEDTNRDRLEKLRAEADQEVKDALRSELEAKFQL